MAQRKTTLTPRQRSAIKAAQTRRMYRALDDTSEWFIDTAREFLDVENTGDVREDSAEIRALDPVLFDLMRRAAIERSQDKSNRNRPRGPLAKFLEYIGRRDPSLSDRGIKVGDTP